MTPDLVIGDDGEVLGMDDPIDEAAQMRSIIADFADQDEKSIVKFFARLGVDENLTLIPNMPIPNPKEWEGTKSYLVMTPFGFYRLDLNNGNTETREKVTGFIADSADRGSASPHLRLRMRDESPEIFFERGLFKTEYIWPGNNEGDATLVLLKDPDELVAAIKLVAEAFSSQLEASKRAIETAREALEKTKREE